mmetsp:Transcript_1565/g.2080  ORF Transcript_1565/g.2080 Transcript_1565/m.2080 type:complete len:217 (+) Transcript_1565:123-773(+)
MDSYEAGDVLQRETHPVIEDTDAEAADQPQITSQQHTRGISRTQAQPRKKQYAISTRWEREYTDRGPKSDYNRYFCCCARRLGNMFILYEQNDGAPTVIAGPCWPFCVGVTLPLIVGISFLVCFFILFNTSAGVPSWVGYIYLFCLAMVLAALFMVSCRDPGLMERVVDEEAGRGGWFWNEQVGSFRPPGALYCRECGVRCIVLTWLYRESRMKGL